MTRMRRWVSLAVGVVIGQWLAFGGLESPAAIHTMGMVAWERQDYAEAARLWSVAASLQPDNPTFHYLRATALARLGHRRSAADAYETALLFASPETLVRRVQGDLARLEPPRLEASETTVTLEPARGVWIAPVTLNGRRTARFLVDTGASVTVLSPGLAERAGVRASAEAARVEMTTIAGPAGGPTATIDSLTVGDVELRGVPAVIHDPGLGVEGILGNSVLGQFTMTLDPDRRLLHLRPFARP